MNLCGSEPTMGGMEGKSLIRQVVSHSSRREHKSRSIEATQESMGGKTEEERGEGGEGEQDKVRFAHHVNRVFPEEIDAFHPFACVYPMQLDATHPLILFVSIKKRGRW
jgi:hypothetical protein